MDVFNIGEELVWMHIDDQTGQRTNDLVRVMRAPGGLRTRSAQEQYQVMVLRTNEPALAFRDELRRYE